MKTLAIIASLFVALTVGNSMAFAAGVYDGGNAIDGSGYYGAGSATGGPAGGLPNNN